MAIFDTECPPIPDRLLDMFRGHEDYLAWSPDIPGNAIIEGRMVLGLQAGPSIVVSSLLHEMGHLIEIDDARCHLYGWGLRVRQVEVLGRTYAEPMTFQCTEREIRVLAIEMFLGEYVGCPVNAQELAEVTAYLPDWWNWSARYDGDAVFGTKAWYAPIRDDIVAQKEALRMDDVMKEWQRKCLILKDRLPGRSRHARLGSTSTPRKSSLRPPRVS